MHLQLLCNRRTKVFDDDVCVMVGCSATIKHFAAFYSYFSLETRISETNSRVWMLVALLLLYNAGLIWGGPSKFFRGGAKSPKFNISLLNNDLAQPDIVYTVSKI